MTYLLTIWTMASLFSPDRYIAVSGYTVNLTSSSYSVNMLKFIYLTLIEQLHYTVI